MIQFFYNNVKCVCLPIVCIGDWWTTSGTDTVVVVVSRCLWTSVLEELWVYLCLATAMPTGIFPLTPAKSNYVHKKPYTEWEGRIGNLYIIWWVYSKIITWLRTFDGCRLTALDSGIFFLQNQRRIVLRRIRCIFGRINRVFVSGCCNRSGSNYTLEEQIKYWITNIAKTKTNIHLCAPI